MIEFFFGAVWRAFASNTIWKVKATAKNPNYDFPNAPGGNYNPMNSVLLEGNAQGLGSIIL